jgi:hypothetical protein
MICNTCNKSFTSKAGFRYHTREPSIFFPSLISHIISFAACVIENGVCKTTLAGDERNEDIQPTGRRAARKNYKLDEDSEESDSDDDASVVSVKAKAKTRKRISTSE